MRLDRFNLNLFVAFDALAEARTLTEAATSLCLTQPAMSAALRQMREYFDDDLVVYGPRRKELTPLGKRLHARVRDILGEARMTLKLRELPSNTVSSEVSGRQSPAVVELPTNRRRNGAWSSPSADSRGFLRLAEPGRR